ncbi:energy-coupling factor transporter transmembrane component T family protein [Falsibacillus pallidus]|uniref:energy-coupling factor transporter transmembrane component T family protein n=1 Tax=Falsibacillus pallidus TaxID=493781 RepID=UPI003D99A60E
MQNEMLSYIDRNSPIHRLTGAAKLICFVLWTFAVMLTYDTRILVFLFLVSGSIFVISKVRLKEIGFVLSFILIFMMINNFAIYLFSPQEAVGIYGTKHVLAEIWGRYSITSEQIFYQMNITLKYLTVIPAALLFIVTTHPSEFASSLNKLGVNYRIAYSVSIAMRYIPDIQREYKEIALSQQARGLDMSKKEKLAVRIKNAGSIIMPLIFSSLDRIEIISNAMDLRGFGKKKTRTWYAERPFRKGDYIAVGLIAALLIISLIVTFHDGSRFYNPFI